MATNLGTLTLNLLANTGSYTQGLQRAERQTRQSTENMSQDYNLVGKTIGELKNSVVGYMAGIVSVGAAIAKMDSYTGLQNRLKLVTTSQAELNQAMQDTFSIAQATGQSWDSTAQVYQRFADNAKRLGITFQETAVLTDTVARAIAISGGSAASAEAALVQFGQALASGVLRGEEFNSISEQAPGLLKAIATGLNVNIGELRKMANEGKLTADVVIKSLNAAKSSVDTLFGKTDFTIGMSFTQLNNALTEFVGEAGKSSGAAQLISGSIQGLAANLDAVTNVAMVSAAFYVGSYIPAMYKSVAASAARVQALMTEIEVENAAIVQAQRKAQAAYNTAQAEMTRARDAVIAAEMEVNANRSVIQSEIQRIQASIAATNAAKAQEAQSLSQQYTEQGRAMSISRMATLQQAQALMTAELTVLEQRLSATTVEASASHIAVRNAQTVATERLTIATSELNIANSLTTRTSFGLLGALGGPMGLGLMVAGVAASYLLLSDNSDKANESLASQVTVVSELAQKYQELSLAKLQAEKDKLFEEQEKSISKVEKSLSSLKGVADSFSHGDFATSEQIGKTDALRGIIDGLKAGTKDSNTAIIELRKNGFNDQDISKVSALFNEYDDGKKSLNELNMKLALVAKSQGFATDETDKWNKKLGDQKEIITALNKSVDSSNEAFNVQIKYIRELGSTSATTVGQQQLINDAIDKYQNGTMTASKLAEIFKSNLKIDQPILKSFIDQAIAVDNVKKELDKENMTLGLMNKQYQVFLNQHGQIIQANQNEANSIDQKRTAQEKYLKSIQDKYAPKNLEADFIMLNTKVYGGNSKALDKSKAASDFYKENNIPMTRSLTKDELSQFDKYYAKQQQLEKMANDINESEKRSEDAAKKRESDRKKAADDAKKLREQQFQDREDIYYKYASREVKIEQDLQKEISKIQKSNFSPKDTAGYIQNAQMRSSIEIQLYQAQLDAELNDWKSTEQEKLNQKVYVNELMIQLDADMNDKQKQQAMQSLIARSNQELSWMKLEEAQRISDAGEALRTDLQNIEIKYAFERKKIEENAQLSQDERQKRVALSFAAEEHQKRQNLNSATAAWGGTYADLTGTGAQYQMERDKFSKYDESQALFDAQMALAQSAEEREAIWQAHNDRMAMIDQDYWTRSAQMNLSYGENIAGSFADMAKSIYGEQSSTYRAMFAVQKAFSIASSIVAITNGIALAAANPFPYNLAAMATVAASTATLVSDISSVAGFATGGHIKGQGSGTSDDIPIWASNGEFMIRTAAVEKLGLANLDYINRTGMLPPRFADGGLINSDIMKTKTIANTPSKGVDYNAMQSQQQQPTVDNNMKVLIFDDRASYEQEMMGPTGERIFLYHWKRNQSKLSR